jgi:hypothetical protein
VHYRELFDQREQVVSIRHASRAYPARRRSSAPRLVASADGREPNK